MSPWECLSELPSVQETDEQGLELEFGWGIFREAASLNCRLYYSKSASAFAKLPTVVRDHFCACTLVQLGAMLRFVDAQLKKQRAEGRDDAGPISSCGKPMFVEEGSEVMRWCRFWKDKLTLEEQGAFSDEWHTLEDDVKLLRWVGHSAPQVSLYAVDDPMRVVMHPSVHQSMSRFNEGSMSGQNGCFVICCQLSQMLLANEPVFGTIAQGGAVADLCLSLVICRGAAVQHELLQLKARRVAKGFEVDEYTNADELKEFASLANENHSQDMLAIRGMLVNQYDSRLYRKGILSTLVRLVGVMSGMFRGPAAAVLLQKDKSFVVCCSNPSVDDAEGVLMQGTRFMLWDPHKFGDDCCLVAFGNVTTWMEIAEEALTKPRPHKGNTPSYDWRGEAVLWWFGTVDRRLLAHVEPMAGASRAQLQKLLGPKVEAVTPPRGSASEYGLDTLDWLTPREDD